MTTDLPDPPWHYLPSPCILIDRALLDKNLEILDQVQQAGGAKVLLTLKSFATWSVFPQLARILHGTAASSLNEARLGRKQFGKDLHVNAVAYKQEELATFVEMADYLTFNSLRQWQELKVK